MRHDQEQEKKDDAHVECHSRSSAATAKVGRSVQNPADKKEPFPTMQVCPKAVCAVVVDQDVNLP
jgi:hypothetical protein